MASGGEPHAGEGRNRRFDTAAPGAKTIELIVKDAAGVKE
jgi:hypothetical protein